MLKFLLVCFLLISFQANDSFSDNYLNIVAKKIQTNNGVLDAQDSVIAYSDNYYLKAERLLYDQKNSIINLNTKSFLSYKNSILFSEIIKIHLNTDYMNLGPSLFFDEKSQLWFSAKKFEKDKNFISLDDTILSSCDCEDPAWSIRFSKGDYNTTKEWINTYNTKLYLGNVPILYTPYFGFPTNSVRSSGLLRPRMGYSKNEGFLYAQPIYYAPSVSWDMELIPQMRNQRGSGAALKYRLADSKNSKLYFEYGVFQEDESYFNENNLENKKHYGLELSYKKSKIFSSNNTIDGLSLNILDMNDVDYMNTKYDNDASNYTNKYLNSYLSYYYSSQTFLGGFELNYYNDISKDDTSSILQEIPQLNFSKYSNYFKWNNLNYNLDVKSSQKIRPEGINANLTSIDLPISFSLYTFEEYLKLDLEQSLKYQYLKYSNEKNFSYKDGSLATGISSVALSTDLIKKFDNFNHNIKLYSKFTDENNIKSNGDLYALNNNSAELQDFELNSIENRFIDFGFQQSFYDRYNKEVVFHKLSQTFTYDKDSNKYEESDIYNNFDISLNNFYFSNKVTFDNKKKKVADSTTTFKIKWNKIDLESYHLYSYDLENSLRNEDIIYSLKTDLNRHYGVNYMREYDIENSLLKKQSIGIDIDKSCWGVNLKLTDAIVASSSDESMRQKVFYFQLDLKKLFQIDQEYKFRPRQIQ